MTEQEAKEQPKEYSLEEISLKEIQELNRAIKEADTHPDKFTIVDTMNTPNRMEFFTEFKDLNDVKRMNTIEMYVALKPLVYGNTSAIRLTTKIHQFHIKQHKLNMISLKREREKMIRDTLRADSSMTTVTTDAKRFMGMK